MAQHGKRIHEDHKGVLLRLLAFIGVVSYSQHKSHRSSHDTRSSTSPRHQNNDEPTPSTRSMQSSTNDTDYVLSEDVHQTIGSNNRHGPGILTQTRSEELLLTSKYGSYEPTDEDRVKMRHEIREQIPHSEKPHDIPTSLTKQDTIIQASSKNKSKRKLDPTTSESSPDARLQEIMIASEDIKEICDPTEQLKGELEYWKGKCSAEKAKRTKLQERIRSLKSSLEDESKRAESYLQTSSELEDRWEKLQSVHIKAINNVNSGLEPISDQEFKSKFRGLSDEIYEWCRRAFKKGPVLHIDEMHPQLKTLLAGRVQDTSLLTSSRLIEATAWSFMERHLLGIWYPAISEDTYRSIQNIHGMIRDGDNTENLERSDYWRAYTASLLFQNLAQQKKFKDTKLQVDKLLECLGGVQRNHTFQIDFLPRIQKSLHSIILLSAELKCQRGVYEIDESIEIGDVYDESRMIDVQFRENEEGTIFIVSTIISKGWVKRQSSGSRDIIEQICKARVQVQVA